MRRRLLLHCMVMIGVYLACLRDGDEKHDTTFRFGSLDA
jgi:hypothetical protein